MRLSCGLGLNGDANGFKGASWVLRVVAIFSNRALAVCCSDVISWTDNGYSGKLASEASLSLFLPICLKVLFI